MGQKYLRGKAGRRDEDLAYSMGNEMEDVNIAHDDSEVSLRPKNADSCQRRHVYTNLKVIGEMCVEDRTT